MVLRMRSLKPVPIPSKGHPYQYRITPPLTPCAVTFRFAKGRNGLVAPHRRPLSEVCAVPATRLSAASDVKPQPTLTSLRSSTYTSSRRSISLPTVASSPPTLIRPSTTQPRHPRRLGQPDKPQSLGPSAVLAAEATEEIPTISDNAIQAPNSFFIPLPQTPVATIETVCDPQSIVGPSLGLVNGPLAIESSNPAGVHADDRTCQRRRCRGNPTLRRLPRSADPGDRGTERCPRPMTGLLWAADPRMNRGLAPDGDCRGWR